MFYYVKLVGDEPCIVETEKDLKRDDVIMINPENLYFLVAMMGPGGQQGMVPVSAVDNGLEDSEIMIYGDQISMMAKLGDKSPIVDGIEKSKKAKSGIITPDKPKLVI